MKTTATLTSKGQITIPSAVRRELGLHSGDTLEFECHGDKAEVRAVRPRGKSAGVLNRFLPKNWKPPTVEEMDAGIARNLAEKHRRK